MIDFLANYGIEIFLSLLTAGLLGLCKYFHGEMKKYKDLIEKADQDEINKMIDKKLEPVVASIDDLNDRFDKAKKHDEDSLHLIVDGYKHRLITLCRHYIARGYMTGDEYAQLSELYKIYHELGGNSQGTDYYEKATSLEVKGQAQE